MERRVNLSILLSLLCICLFFSLGIAAFLQHEETSFQEALQRDLEKVQQDDGDLERLYREEHVSDLEKEQMQRLEIITEKGELQSVYLPKRDFLYTFKSILPITTLVMGLFVVLTPLASRMFTKKTLEPIIQSMEEIQGILGGRETEHNKETYPELETLIKEIEYEKAQITYSMNQLIESEQMRRDFTANVSHELKTPLTSINGYAEMIESGITSPEDTKKFAGIILHEGKRLLHLIDDTIRLSLLEKEEKFNLMEDTLDLYTLAEEVVKKHEISAMQKNVTMRITGESAFVKGNHRMLEDVITNLISNAIKYNKPGGSVDVIVQKEERKVLLIVKDTGIGISEEDQPRVFERFYMGNKARTNKQGTGLGLSIVKHVVKLHHGEIHLKSNIGDGTTMTIALQKARP